MTLLRHMRQTLERSSKEINKSTLEAMMKISIQYQHPSLQESTLKLHLKRLNLKLTTSQVNEMNLFEQNL